MTTYIDTYIACAEAATLSSFVSQFANVTPLQKGRAAAAGSEQVGDPSLWYACVRTTFDPTPFLQAPFTKVDAATGSRLVSFCAA